MRITKQILRQQLLKKRTALTLAQKTEAAHCALQHMQNTPLWLESAHIACYNAMAHEFSMEPIIQAIWVAKKHCYLPIMHKNKQLAFAQYTPETPLIKNKVGIAEPTSPHLSHLNQLDIIFTPLLGYDARGNRLGMGQGYYDRTLANLNKPTIIGVGFTCQEIDAIPNDIWDISLHSILTESGWFSFHSVGASNR